MKRLFIILFSFAILAVSAQKPAKRALSVSDFAIWETVGNSHISNDGEWVSYQQDPQRGDGTLMLFSEQKSYSFNRGNNAAFGPESNYLVFKIKPYEDEVRKAKVKKVKKEKMPKDSIGVFLFTDGETKKFSRIKSFKVPEDNGFYFAFLQEPADQKNDSTQNNKDSKGKKVKKSGDNLVVFNSKSGDTLVFRQVTEYCWSKNGQALFFVSEEKDSVNTRSSVFAFESKEGRARLLFQQKGFVKSVASEENGSLYAFLFSKDTTKQKEYALYLGETGRQPEMIVDGYTQGMPVGWSPSENGKVWFSEDGSKLYFGTARTPEQAPKDTIPEDEKPQVDVWNWQDIKIQPQQKAELEKEKKRTYQAVYHIALKNMVQLADIIVRNVTTPEKGNGNTGLGSNELPYLREASWTGEKKKDYYLVDFVSGIKREVLKKQSFVSLSPHAKYLVWYDFADSSYYAKSTGISHTDTISLTKKIPVNFFNEWHDTPSDAKPYGVAGWGENDRYIFIYDRYDIWKIDVTGEKVPVNITKTFGRRNKTRLRYVKLDKELEFIPMDKKLLIRAFNEQDMSAGFFNALFSTVKDPTLLMMEKNRFRTPVKAKNADKIIWTKESVAEFPDLWISDKEFKAAKKISDANPWQDEFIWPTVEIVEWESFSGEKLRGLLYKPENFDANKSYPMMIYYYERNSETVYRYHQPAPSRSVFNKTLYVSNGYLVFVPDITYKTGYPGQSAYNAIVSGTQYLITKYPFIDKKHIGLQGQSWGGYQTAYLVTQTDMFAAAMAGAPVSNMTSAYGGIRWKTGLSRMFQYEHTQSRIGGTLWEKPLHYIENSPLFYAPKIHTPLLIMHNDKDGAVPWYQGIELFVALRRLNKPAWMLTYNGEPHNLKAESWANRMDLSIRMLGFFNHFLKGQPEPEWMEKGIPAIEKEKNRGY